MVHKKEKNYLKMLDEALIQWDRGNDGPIKAVCEERRLRLFEKREDLTDEEAEILQKCAICKVITARTALPQDVRQRAFEFLKKHGFQPLDAHP